MFIEQHRSEMIDYLLSAPPAPDPEASACSHGVDCACYAAGYAAGLEHATAELLDWDEEL